MLLNLFNRYITGYTIAIFRTLNNIILLCKAINPSKTHHNNDAETDDIETYLAQWGTGMQRKITQPRSAC